MQCPNWSVEEQISGSFFLRASVFLEIVQVIQQGLMFSDSKKILMELMESSLTLLPPLSLGVVHQVLAKKKSKFMYFSAFCRMHAAFCIFEFRGTKGIKNP